MKPPSKRLVLASWLLLLFGLVWFFLKSGAAAGRRSQADAPLLDEQTVALPPVVHSGGQSSRDFEPDQRVKSLLAALKSEPDPDQQNDVLERAVDSIPEQNLRSTLETLQAQEGETAGLLRRSLIRRWAEIDPRAASQWIIKLSDGVAYQEAVQQVAVAWAGVDPQAATGWVACLPESPIKSELLLQVGYEVAGSEPTMALRIASTLPAGTDRDHLVVHAVSQWASSDAQAVGGWIAGIPDGTLREQLLTALACSVAVKDGAAAGALVAGTLAPGVEQDRAVIEIVQRWAQSSPSSAGSWITAFPDVPLRETALQTLLTIWSMQDHAGAASWVGTLPAGPLRQAGLTALAAATTVLPK